MFVGGRSKPFHPDRPERPDLVLATADNYGHLPHGSHQVPAGSPSLPTLHRYELKVLNIQRG